MTADHHEQAFETVIKHHLLEVAGYVQADPAAFDRERALEVTVLLPCQCQTWQAFQETVRDQS